MRTKILLTAAAALAAGLVSSNAQVYSANVVGYVNVVYPGGQYVMSANPFTTGNDVLTNVLQGVTGASSMAYWTGTGFSTYTYSGLQKKWLNGATDVSGTSLPPGLGYFIKAGGAGFTNTYVGTVVANSGGTATNTLVAGYQPVGETVPYVDVVTNTSTINLLVAGASTMAIWDQPSQSYAPTFTYSGLQHVWKQGATTTNPPINSAQGFFINPAVGTNWVQTLNP